MSSYTFTEQDGKHLLKEGRRIRGYVTRQGEGYAYCIGKPSDACVAMFTANTGAFTVEQAKQRLLDACTL
jgi:hypothetical protein